ncbi:MAG: GNAT family N-acetyltransferase [Desulfurispora sp.]|uniref:GNAT family N-acetyltransferase n=1 Tax=Desulfurispora sp. TaxID=3014275 RepID=UPI00404960D1
MDIHITGPLSAEQLQQLDMSSELNNFRPYQRQKQALINITTLPLGRIYAACHRETIIGYVAFHAPDPDSRYARHPLVLELGGVEVARSWRRRHVGSALLDYIFSDPYYEDYIVITTEYYRHWDLAGNNMDVWQYRRLLDRFFGRVGFFPQATRDPDILEHPANVLMARPGRRVDLESLMFFEDILHQE